MKKIKFVKGCGVVSADGKRWATDGVCLALSDFWKLPDQRMAEWFLAGKSWDCRSTLIEGCELEGAVEKLLNSISAQLIELRPTNLWFKEWKVFVGQGEFILIYKKYLLDSISWRYDPTTKCVVGQAKRFDGPLHIIVKTPENAQEQFKEELQREKL